MKLARMFSNEERTIRRWACALTTILLLDSVQDFAKSLILHNRADFVFYLLLGIILVLTWPVLMTGRLIELRLSRLWILPILIPIVIAMIAAFKGWPLVFRIADGIAFALQLPLIFLSKPKELLPLQIESSNGPKP